LTSISTIDAAAFSASAIPGRCYYDQRPTCQLYELLPFIPIQGHELRINVAPSSALGTFADAEDAGGALAQNWPSLTTRSFELVRISAELPVDGIITGVYGADNALLDTLVRIKVEAVRDRFKVMLFAGDPSINAAECLGLRRLVETVTLLSVRANSGAGGTVLAGEVEALLALISTRWAGSDLYLVMHAKAYRHLLRHNYREVEFGRHSQLGWIPVISGVPVLIDNFIPTNVNVGFGENTTSIYAVILGENHGLCGIHPAANPGGDILVRGPSIKSTSDAEWFHASWDVGIALYNGGALARLDGVQHAN